MAGQFVSRFFGGSPLASIVKLAFVSLVVGAVLMWLDIEPLALLHLAERTLVHIWAMGFDGLREVGHLVVAGALVVVPIWLLARLFSLRGAR